MHDSIAFAGEDGFGKRLLLGHVESELRDAEAHAEKDRKGKGNLQGRCASSIPEKLGKEAGSRHRQPVRTEPVVVSVSGDVRLKPDTGNGISTSVLTVMFMNC